MFEKKDSVFVSGEKKIGEKAKGKIVILNKRKDGEKKFNNATVFTCNKVQFSLNEEIKVASASVKKNDEGETISYGRIESSLTAIEIGKEGNLVKDSKCVIGNHSPDDYEAIISENFTGGSSEILKIVTKKDQDELLAKVQATVLKEVADFFKKQSRDGKFYEFNNDFEIISNEFDKKVNEEATVLNLNLKIRAKAIVYKKSDMKEFVSQMLRQNLPEGYELSNKEPDLISNVVKDASASANKKDVSAKKTTNFIYLQVKVNQNAFAKIDSEEIKQQLNSLNYLKAKEVLQSRSAEIKDFEIKFQPSFAQFLGKIPQNKKNIFIDIIGNDET